MDRPGERRWLVRVCTAAGLSVAAWVVFRSGPVALAVGVGAASWGVGRTLAGIIGDRLRRLSRATSERLSKARRHRADELTDSLTHGPFRAAREVVGSPRYPAGSHREVAAAARSVQLIEGDLQATIGARGNAVTKTPLLGGVAVEMADRFDPIPRYGDPLRAPRWLRPRGRRLVTAVGRFVDDLRLLHNAQIEWSVLLFMLWTRALLVGLAPVLGGLTPAPVPLAGPLEAADAVWLVTALWAAGCALAAPRVATLAMERSARAARARTILLFVEVPLFCAVTFLFPAWFVAAFAAGWVNWWQRHWNSPLTPARFSFVRLAAFIAVVAATLAAGSASAALGGSEAIVEIALTFAVIGIISSSYGAMLPVSISVAVQLLWGAAAGRRRARRAATRRLDEAVAHLDAAAREIEGEAPADPVARADAAALRDAARQLRLRQRVDSSGARTRAKPDLLLLIEEALEAGAGESLRPSISPKRLRAARPRRRGDARTLMRLVVCCAVEARVHGAGPLEVIVRLDGERVVLRFANAPSPSPPSRGRGRGAREIRSLATALPEGELRFRGLTDSTFVDGTGAYDVYAVEVTFDLGALEYTATPELVAS